MTNEITKMIEELKEEDKRLNQIIINLYDDIGRYKQKIVMQDHIIDTQQEIIKSFCGLVGMINDKSNCIDRDLFE